MNEFPKYKYHAELDPVVVQDETDEAELGEGWANSPADHGVITAPSKAQTLKAKIEAAGKDGKRKKQKDE